MSSISRQDFCLEDDERILLSNPATLFSLLAQPKSWILLIFPWALKTVLAKLWSKALGNSFSNSSAQKKWGFARVREDRGEASETCITFHLNRSKHQQPRNSVSHGKMGRKNSEGQEWHRPSWTAVTERDNQTTRLPCCVRNCLSNWQMERKKQSVKIVKKEEREE
jgi:hypothetical protein